MNFTWWLNRLDPENHDLFGGGFLGFDNISPIDRSHLPAGARMEQADGTAWTAVYALAMLLMAAELAEHDPVYDDMVVKFLEHFASISRALHHSGMWDPDDAYFYDRLLRPDGEAVTIRVQSIAGAIPLLAGTLINAKHDERTRRLGRRFRRMEEAQGFEGSARAGQVHRLPGGDQLLVSLVAPDALRTALRTLFDPEAFLSPHGLRSVSKRYDGRPYEVPGVPGATIDYQPAESRNGMYGGNSNWRGPVWFPTNCLVIMSLLSPPPLPGKRVHARSTRPDRASSTRSPRSPATSPTGSCRSGCPTKTAAVPCTAGPSASRPTRPGGTTCCSSSTSTATTAPDSGPPTRPAGPRSWPSCSCTRRPLGLPGARTSKPEKPKAARKQSDKKKAAAKKQARRKAAG